MLRTSPLAFALALLGAAPQAAPTANPPVGVGPLTVTFSSIPPDGVLYEWDFDYLPAAGFTPDFTDVVAGDVTTSYGPIGLYTARLVITDDQGAQTTHDVAVAVTDRWEPLHGAWRAGRCLPVLAEAFGRGERAVHRALALLDVGEVAIADPSSLRSVNRPADLHG